MATCSLTTFLTFFLLIVGVQTWRDRCHQLLQYQGAGKGGKTKLISCTLCQQRKVKCDKGQPTCFNCARHRASCVYVAPAKSQRKKRKSSEEELIDRLKRYESLLEAHGILLDDLDPTLAAIRNNRGLEPSKTPILTEQVSSP